MPSFTQLQLVRLSPLPYYTSLAVSGEPKSPCGLRFDSVYVFAFGVLGSCSYRHVNKFGHFSPCSCAWGRKRRWRNPSVNVRLGNLSEILAFRRLHHDSEGALCLSGKILNKKADSFACGAPLVGQTGLVTAAIERIRVMQTPPSR